MVMIQCLLQRPFMGLLVCVYDCRKEFVPYRKKVSEKLRFLILVDIFVISNVGGMCEPLNGGPEQLLRRHKI